MKILYEKRASTVLFNFLKSNCFQGKFLLPANLCPIVFFVFKKARQPFEIIDISETDLTIRHERVLDKIKNRKNEYSGFFFLRTYGLLEDCEPFFKKIKRIHKSIVIIDDRCLSIPEFDLIESCADLVLFSTGYAKYVDIGGYGYGQLLRSHAYARRSEGFNAEHLNALTDMYKTMLNSNCQLPYIDYSDTDWLDFRNVKLDFSHYQKHVENEINKSAKIKDTLNDLYMENLPDSIILGEKYNTWRFNIIVKNKTLLLKKLVENDLFASSHYPPLSKLIGSGKMPVAEKLHSKIVNLFNDRYYSIKKAEKTIAIIKRHVEKHGTICPKTNRIGSNDG